MELEDIYKKYPWLTNYTSGSIYTPMVEAATGKRVDINPMDYFEAVVTINVKEYNQAPAYAVSVVKQNVGYWAGYFDMEAMQKVKEVYGAEHPIFG